MLQGNKKGCALPSNRTRPRTVQRPLRKSFEGGVLPVRVSWCPLANFRRLELFWDTESSTSHTTPLCVRGVVVGWLVLCLVHTNTAHAARRDRPPRGTHSIGQRRARRPRHAGEGGDDGLVNEHDDPGDNDRTTNDHYDDEDDRGDHVRNGDDRH